MDLFPSSPAGAGTRYYPPRGKLLLHTLLAWGTGGIALVPAMTGPPIMAGIAWVVVALVTPAGLVLLARAVRPGPTLVVDDDGIIDRTTLTPTGRLRWDEITVIRKKEIGRGMGAERLLEIVPANPAALRSRPRSWLRRLSDGYRAVLHQPAVTIPSSMVSVPLPVVMEEIQQRHPRLQVLQGPPPAPSKWQLVRGKRPPEPKHPHLPRW